MHPFDPWRTQKKEEVEIMNDSAKAHGRKFAVMFNQRTSTLFSTARQIVKSGELGELKRAVWIITNWYRTQSYYDSCTWRGTYKTEGGGVLINQSIHTLDLMQWYMGEVESIKGHAFTDYHDYIEVEDTSSINLTFKNGTHGIFFATTAYCENPSIFLEICGENGVAVIDGPLLTVRYANGTEEMANNDSTAPNGKDYWGNAHAHIIADFYKGLGKKPFWISAEEGMKTLRILKEVYRQSGIEK